MLSPWEEKEILQGIDEIIFNLEHVPVQDVAFFLVKNNPKLAEQLSAQINFTFQDFDLLQLQKKEKYER